MVQQKLLRAAFCFMASRAKASETAISNYTYIYPVAERCARTRCLASAIETKNRPVHLILHDLHSCLMIKYDTILNWLVGCIVLWVCVSRFCRAFLSFSAGCIYTPFCIPLKTLHRAESSMVLCAPQTPNILDYSTLGSNNAWAFSICSL